MNKIKITNKKYSNCNDSKKRKEFGNEPDIWLDEIYLF